MSEEKLLEVVKKVGEFKGWYILSRYYPLDETFMRKYKWRLNWLALSECQKMNEMFIEEHAGLVNWNAISMFQKLSSDFIKRNISHLSTFLVLKYQRIPETEIERYMVTKELIEHACQYQRLSEEMIGKYNLQEKIKDNWIYKSTEEKKQEVVNSGLYECYDSYFIAYKGIRKDRYSRINFQYKYLKGETYLCHADHTDAENSFGFSAWTKEKAKEYCDELVIKGKIYYHGVARIFPCDGKIRCKRLTVLD